MALPKLFQRIFWHNNTTPAIQEDNLNAMSKGLSDVDDRVIGLAGTIMEDVPQILEDMEILEPAVASIASNVQRAETAATNAETAAGAAEYSADAAAGSATSASNSATAAENSATTAGNKALVSEGYADGKQNGSPVASGSPYYQNNSKYYSEVAASQATNASNSATAAAGSATNASNSANAAAGSAQAASNKANEASASATNASNSATAASASETAAETYKDMAEAAAEAAAEIIGATTITVDYETGNLVYSNDAYYLFAINTTTGNLEWEVVA